MSTYSRYVSESFGEDTYEAKWEYVNDCSCELRWLDIEVSQPCEWFKQLAKTQACIKCGHRRKCHDERL